MNTNTITTKTKLSYAAGGLGKNLAYGFVASYTLYYYNTILGISASFVGVLLMVARIFDAFNDPLMGVVVAKTKSRHGRYKPWILSGAILNALVLYAMFDVPDVLTGGGLKAYVVVTYFLCGITYTLSDIPYWSVIPAITRAGTERESLTVFARTCSGFGAALPTVLTMSLLPLLGGGTDTGHYRKGFGILALVVAIFYVVTSIITVRNLPNDELCEPRDSSVKELLNALLKNDQALNLAAIIILFNSAIYMTTNLLLYVFQYDVGDESLYTCFMVVSGLVQFATMTIFYPFFRKKFSNRRIFQAACLVGILGYLGMTALIFGKTMTLAKLLLPGALISFANGIGYVLTTVFVADAVDYGEAQTGQREDSVVSSLQTLMVKLATSVASFVAGIGIDLAGIDTDAAVQTAAAKTSLRTLFAIPSLLLMTAALLILLHKKEIGAER
ncbi:MAG: glycoside-pentoside-hexuronide (GPH):cation symporter [Lachnospiraceae bacterium]|nr:glycoside-pentoside-hexuronide (GPH):cation symporter [Lachnospiraceae bacterium]